MLISELIKELQEYKDKLGDDTSVSIYDVSVDSCDRRKNINNIYEGDESLEIWID